MKRCAIALAVLALTGCATLRGWTFGAGVDRVPETQCTEAQSGRYCLGTIWIKASRRLE